MRRFCLALAIITLAACSKEAAVESGLVDAGIAAPAASCMAQEMAKRLSASQLQKLSRVPEAGGKPLAQMDIADYVAAAKRVGDAEVIVVTGAAAAACGAL